MKITTTYFYYLLLILCSFSWTTLKGQEVTNKEKMLLEEFDQVLNSDLSDSLKIIHILDNIQKLSREFSSVASKTAPTIIKEGIALAEKLNNLELKAKLNLQLAAAYSNVNRLDSARYAFLAAIESFDEANLVYFKIRAIQSFSGHLADKAQLDKALQEGYRGLAIAEDINHQEAIAWMKGVIAKVLLQSGKDAEALQYAEESLGAFQALNQFDGILYSLNIVINTNINLGNFEKALILLNMALGQIQTTNIVMSDSIQYEDVNKFALYQGLLSRANVFEKLERYDEALMDIDSSHQIMASGNDMIMDARLINRKGTILLKQKKYAQAKSVFLELLQHPNLAEDNLESDCYNNLASSCAKLLQFDLAYYYQSKGLEYEWKQKTYESALNMEKLKTEYETKEKEERIVVQQNQLLQNSKIQNLTMGIVAMLASLLFALFYNFRKNKKINTQLNIKNEENELLLKEIHHRVKNNLQTISSLLSLQSESLSDKSAFDAVQESRNRITTMALLHQKLYQGKNLAAIEMRDYFETIGNAIIDSYGEKAENISLSIEMPVIELDVDRAIPVGLITNELITNSIKHAFPDKQKGLILITLKQEKNGLLTLNVTDNGQATADKSDVKGEKGFGTMLIQLLTRQLEGKLEKSIVGGTSIIVQFPSQEKSVA